MGKIWQKPIMQLNNTWGENAVLLKDTSCETKQRPARKTLYEIRYSSKHTHSHMHRDTVSSRVIKFTDFFTMYTYSEIDPSNTFHTSSDRSNKRLGFRMLTTLKEHLFGLFNRYTGSLLTGNSIMIRYQRGNFKRCKVHHFVKHMIK